MTSIYLFGLISFAFLSCKNASAGAMQDLIAHSQSPEWKCTYVEMHTIPFTQGNYGKSFNGGIAQINCSDRSGEKHVYDVGCIPEPGGGFPSITECARQAANPEKNYSWIPAARTARPSSWTNVDKHGRRCSPISTSSRVFHRETDKLDNFDAVCLTAITCSPMGPKRQSFAACLPRNKSGEPTSDGKSFDSCPAIIDCINDPFPLKPAQTAEELSRQERPLKSSSGIGEKKE